MASNDRIKLGKREIDLLACPPGIGSMMVFDKELPGFGIRVTAKGAKTFVFQYRHGSAVRRMILGDYGTLTPAKARDLAERARVQARAGGDPLGERKAAARATVAAEQEAKRQQLTFADLADSWVSLGLQDRRESYRHEAKRALAVNFPKLATSAAAGVDAAAAITAIDAIATRRGGAMARRSHAYARAMYAWAVRRQLLPANPFAGIESAGRDVRRDRALSDAELAEASRAAGLLGDPFGPCLRFLMLTLQRREEVAGLRWSELSPELAIWTIPAERSKNRKAHIVHLVEPARLILQAVQARQVAAAERRRDPATELPELVFTTTGKTPLSGFSAAKLRLDEKIHAARSKQAAEQGTKPAKLEPWTLHDLRRTGVTTLARLGFAPHVCDRLLNHTTGAIQGVAAIYQRHEFLPERQAALEAWAAHVEALSGDQAARQNVVAFDRPRRLRRAKRE